VRILVSFIWSHL